MARILYPRSNSISAKIVEPSDFERMFDFLEDYVKSGFVVAAGSGLAVTVTSGFARLKGLVCENNSTETVSSLTANTNNYLYLTLARDSNTQAESFSITKNTTGTIATDSMKIAKVVCGASTVTSVSQVNLTDIIQYAFQPTGSIQMYGGQYDNIPNNWLLCNGASVSRTTYEKLFDIIGTQFGGSGSTFNLPDLQAKFTRGATSSANAGTTGGEDTHVLTISEIPSHTHTQNAHSHTYSSAGQGQFSSPNGSHPDEALWATGNTGSTTAVNQNTGGGAGHENRPAFLELLYIIRI